MWFHEYEQSDDSMSLVLRTLGAVFPHVSLFREYGGGRDVIALATREPMAVDFAELERRYDAPGIRDELARMGVYGLPSLLAHHAVSDATFPRVAGEGPLNTDDRERLEFDGPRAFFQDDTANLLWKHDALYNAMSD